MSLMRSRSILLLITFAVTAVIGCVSNQINTMPRDPGSTPSNTLSPTIYYEEGRLVFLSVDVNLSKYQLEADLIPLEIGIVNKGLQTLTVGPELITLRSRNNESWPVASAKESSGNSLRSSFDRSRQPVSFVALIDQRFGNSRFKSSTGVRQGNATMNRTVSLLQREWTAAQIWFPNPGGELKGAIFEVWLNSPELPDPVFTTIRF
jgi:hypothetical protein